MIRLKMLLVKLKKIRRKVMAKNDEKVVKAKVKFTYEDGRKVVRQGASRVFNLRAPLVLNLPQNSKVSVKMGLKCNFPLQLVETVSMKNRGLRLADGVAPTLDADEQIVLTFENISRETQLLESGDVLVRAAVLDNSDLEEEV